MSEESRRHHWEAKADLPLTFTAVLFLVAYAAPILNPSLADPLPAIFEFVTWAAWALFALDYVTRFTLARDRSAFVRGNVIDLAAVALPLLRPLRLLRLVALLSVPEPLRRGLPAGPGCCLRRRFHVAGPVSRITGGP